MKAANIIRIVVCVFLIAGIATAVTYRKQFDVDVLGDWLAGGEGMIQKALLGLSLLALVAFLPRLIKRLRKF